MSLGIPYIYGIGGTVSAPPPPPPIVLDTFHDVSGTDLQDHVADTGQHWTKLVGTIEIVSNLCTPIGGNNVYEISAGQSLFAITVQTNLVTADTELDLYIGTNGPQFYQVYIQPNSNKITFTDSGSNLATTTYTFSAGAQTWKFLATATGLNFYVNGVSVLSYSASLNSYGTNAAIQMFNATSTFSSFEVTNS